MGRRFITAAFVVAALLPQALAAQTPSSSGSKSTPSKTTNHNSNNKNWRHHDRHQSPWNRNVIVTGVNAQDYLYPSYATTAPKPPPKNKVNKPGGTVFKSIGN